MNNSTVIPNPWQVLRQFTAARIALGRTGVSLPTAAQLDFQLAHAQARDAVHLALDAEKLAQELNDLLPTQEAACITLSSAAENRDIYLQRPDLGRKLAPASRQRLEALRSLPAASPAMNVSQRPYELALVIADGLSALAIEQNAAPFLRALMRRLAADNWTCAPITIVRQGRVAIGDEIGELLGAKLVLVLIGERPGLSSPDSMGLYLTWGPRVGLTDESRNCISNVRPAGLVYDEAAFRSHYLLSEARKRSLSGVGLKDETATERGVPGLQERNFLLENH